MSDTMPDIRAAAPRRVQLSTADITWLTEFANDLLPTLQLDDGLFCFDRTWSDPTLRGSSVRYSIMVLLGLARRSAHGKKTSVDVTALHRRIHRERERLGVGDLGLLLWADTRLEDPIAGETLRLLRMQVRRTDALTGLPGMEIGWFVCGAVGAHVSGLPARAELNVAIGELLRRQATTSPLFRHVGDKGWRAQLPNFATQIYSLLALTELARHDLGPRSRSEATRLADRLVELQRPDGGWPWLFHAGRGAVIEPYEIYSVHQDAMAPMAFLALDEVLGGERYRPAVMAGLRWCFGANELDFSFYDTAIGFAHRSIRRSRSSARLDLWTNAAAGSAFAKLPRLDLGHREINTTCRPYHLGWILEAWSR